MKIQKFNTIKFQLFLQHEGGLGRGVLEAIVQDFFSTNLEGRELTDSLPAMTITITQTKDTFGCKTADWWSEAFKVNFIKFDNQITN